MHHSNQTFFNLNKTISSVIESRCLCFREPSWSLQQPFNFLLLLQGSHGPCEGMKIFLLFFPQFFFIDVVVFVDVNVRKREWNKERNTEQEQERARARVRACKSKTESEREHARASGKSERERRIETERARKTVSK